MLMGRRRVFLSCPVVAFSVMLSRSTMRLGGIFVMLSCFLMRVFGHDDLLLSTDGFDRTLVRLVDRVLHVTNA
jgi:hypothetical protein